jgi:hypothetical protein
LEVAVVSNLASSGFTVSLVKVNSLDPTIGLRLNVPACEIAWRPDARYFAVLQSNATCTQATGEIVQVAPNDTRHPVVVAGGASDVTYQAVAPPGTK